MVNSMRMIGIGLMGFLLAGVALLLSTMSFWEKAQWAYQSKINRPQLVFEVPAALPATDEHTAMIVRSNPGQAVILSGLPAYQGVTFDLPQNARPTSGHLQIDATLQVLAGVEGVLRISIDNVRRGEMLLRPGQAGRSLQVLLSPTELAREQLVVSFSLQGDGPSPQCPTNSGYPAIVEIETTSAIYLTLDRPLSSTTDRVNAWGGVVRVGWPNWLQPSEKIRRLALATQFKQHQIPTIFLDGHSDDAFSTVELRETWPILAPAAAAKSAQTSLHHVAQKGANAGLRRFHHATRWRINIDLRKSRNSRIPVELDLHLALGLQDLKDRWSVTVTLNERLLHQDLLEQGATRLGTRVSLPVELMQATNVIEVTLASTRTGHSFCDRPIELIAEMLPETMLLEGDAIFSDALSELKSQLSKVGALRIAAFSNLTASDAHVASDLLAQIVPSDVSIKPMDKGAEIFLLTPNDPSLSLPDTNMIWFVRQDPLTRDLVIDTPTPKSDFSTNRLGLLIISGGSDLAEVAL